MKQRLLPFLLALAVFCTALVPASAAPADDCAQTLYEMGLFRGTGTNPDGSPAFALDQGATRLQGLIMLLRLLGEEEAALAFTGPNPFSDVTGYGVPYVAYAAAQGYTAGSGGGRFGDGPLTVNAFLTFCLRALGWDDRAGDFDYRQALDKAAREGLVDGSWEFSDGGAVLLRADCARLSYNALLTFPKGGDAPMVQALAASGTLSKESAALLEGKARVYGPRPDWAPRVLSAEEKAAWDLGSQARWIEEPVSPADYENNLLYSYALGQPELNFRFHSWNDALDFGVWLETNRPALTEAHPQLAPTLGQEGYHLDTATGVDPYGRPCVILTASLPAPGKTET